MAHVKVEKQELRELVASEVRRMVNFNFKVHRIDDLRAEKAIEEFILMKKARAKGLLRSFKFPLNSGCPLPNWSESLQSLRARKEYAK